MKFTPKRAVKEFASTFKEWHYFVGGGAVGFAAGVYYGMKVATDA